MAIEVGDTVSFEKITSEYEYTIKNLKGIPKKDYLGQSGTVVLVVMAQDEQTNLVIDVKFADGQTWSFEKEQLKKQNKVLHVRCIETGKEYDSVRDAARAYKVTKQAIRIACNNGTMCRKLHWRYIE